MFCLYLKFIPLLKNKYLYLNERMESQFQNFGQLIDDSTNLAAVRLNDAWSNWSDWSRCTVTCGIGQQRRHRHCNGAAKCRGSGHGILKYSKYVLEIYDIIGFVTNLRCVIYYIS